MYVLPYGQMSLWGATVITNLISAIPWIGQDIVESKNIIYLCLCIILLFLILAIDQPLNVSKEEKYSLPTVGILHKNALKKGNKNLRFNKQEYISIPSSFIAFIVGLIDGDGYIQISKTQKGFITMKLVISLHLEDLSTLEYIHSVLKLGKINIYKDLKSPACKLVINKTDLQEVLFPLLLYNKIFFLTNTRIDQFNLAMHILKKNIKLYNEISCLFAEHDRDKTIPKVFEIPDNPFDYTLLHFFKNWIVGFTCAEGSFFIKKNNDSCFQLKQRMHTNLFESFKLIFGTNRKINTSNSYDQFGVSSKADIQKVINFFSFYGLHPLIGLKYIQYIKWLKNMRDNSRYSDLNYPNK